MDALYWVFEYVPAIALLVFLLAILPARHGRRARLKFSGAVTAVVASLSMVMILGTLINSLRFMASSNLDPAASRDLLWFTFATPETAIAVAATILGLAGGILLYRGHPLGLTLSYATYILVGLLMIQQVLIVSAFHPLEVIMIMTAAPLSVWLATVFNNILQDGRTTKPRRHVRSKA